jgi:hypothetical protein
MTGLNKNMLPILKMKIFRNIVSSWTKSSYRLLEYCRDAARSSKWWFWRNIAVFMCNLFLSKHLIRHEPMYFLNFFSVENTYRRPTLPVFFTVLRLKIYYFKLPDLFFSRYLGLYSRIFAF